MLATFTIDTSPGLPAGGTVEIHRDSAFPGGSATPIGTRITTAVTAASGRTPVAGLDYDTNYWAFSLSSGRRVRFRTGPDPGVAFATENDLEVAGVHAHLHGASGAGLVDEIAGLEAARDAAGVGGTVILRPRGSYLVSRPFIPLRGQSYVTHAGTVNWWGQDQDAQLSCRIRGTADFAGEAVVLIEGAAITGAAVEMTAPRFEGVAVDGSLIAAGTPDNWKIKGRVRDAWLARCQSDRARGRGFNIVSNGAGQTAQEARLLYCVATESATDGFGLFAPDVYLWGCEATTNSRDGFAISGASNSELHGCRAEWNGRHGLFHDASVGVSDDLFLGVTTDRNEKDGVHIAANSTNKPITVDLICGRDGRNGAAGGGNYAGLQLGAGGFVGPVIGRVVTWAGRDDGAVAGAFSPQHGIRASQTTVVAVDGMLWGQAAAITNVGSSKFTLGSDTVLVTGDPGAQILTAPVQVDEAGQLSMSKPGEAFARFRLNADGSMEWGSGAAARDAVLKWIFANQLGLGTDDSFVIPAGSGGGYMQMSEQSAAPGNPGADTVRIYVKDNGAGKTQIVARFNPGTEVVIATQP